MSYRILDDPNVPNHLKALYASEEMKVALERQKREEDARNERMEHERQVRESAAADKAEYKRQEERKEEEQRQKAREKLEAELREAFLTAGTGATEGDWNRSKTAIMDQAMKEAALGRGPGDREYRRLLASGKYGF